MPIGAVTTASGAFIDADATFNGKLVHQLTKEEAKLALEQGFPKELIKLFHGDLIDPVTEKSAKEATEETTFDVTAPSPAIMKFDGISPAARTVILRNYSADSGPGFFINKLRDDVKSRFVLTLKGIGEATCKQLARNMAITMDED